MNPHYISNWEAWKELCEYYGVDPHKNIEVGIDMGGGNGIFYEYTGDIPEEEEEE